MTRDCIKRLSLYYNFQVYTHLKLNNHPYENIQENSKEQFFNKQNEWRAVRQ